MSIDNPILVRSLENRRLRYAWAVAASLIASLLAGMIVTYAGPEAAFIPALAAATFCAWYCGIGPTILVVAVTIAGFLFGFVPRFHPLVVPRVSEWIGMFAFLAASALIVFMGETRRGRHHAMLQAQGELEERVRSRTADLDAVNMNLRELSARLMQLQDDERRRIARELHDSVGQTLAALSMNLAMVRTDVEKLSQMAATLSDSESLVQNMSSEVRTISHLLHPPLLDEAGLASALRWYVEGFSQRSKIQVELDLPDNFGRLPGELETAIFRVVQECLTNIHRHSGSPVARIRLRRREEMVMVAIKDEGRGIPPEKLQEMSTSGTLGVGIRGMRERLRQLSGDLTIESGDDGTAIIVKLPVEHRMNETVALDRPSPAAA